MALLPHTSPTFPIMSLHDVTLGSPPKPQPTGDQESPVLLGGCAVAPGLFFML